MRLDSRDNGCAKLVLQLLALPNPLELLLLSGNIRASRILHSANPNTITGSVYARHTFVGR